MQSKNSTAPAGVQQALTEACAFSCMSTGDFILCTKAGTPVGEVMIEVSRLLEGTWMLLRRIEDEGDGDMSGLELGVIRLVIETASALQTSCRRGLALVTTQGAGEVKP